MTMEFANAKASPQNFDPSFEPGGGSTDHSFRSLLVSCFALALKTPASSQ